MGIKTKLIAAIPWIEPVLDYFDWRKRLIALGAGVGLAVWSFVKDLPWPVITVLAAAAAVIVAYALVFPAFLKLVHVGVNPRPNNSIWKHKKQFALIEAACLLADREPTFNPAMIDGDAAAWYGVLYEAIQNNELDYTKTPYDGAHTDASGKFEPPINTPISAASLKKFCEAKDRFPEFLR